MSEFRTEGYPHYVTTYKGGVTYTNYLSDATFSARLRPAEATGLGLALALAGAEAMQDRLTAHLDQFEREFVAGLEQQGRKAEAVDWWHYEYFV